MINRDVTINLAVRGLSDWELKDIIKQALQRHANAERDDDGILKIGGIHVSRKNHVSASSRDGMFCRLRDDGDYDVLHVVDGADVTRMDCRDMHPTIYPVGSSYSTLYEHPEGIVLDANDVARLEIEIE